MLNVELRKNEMIIICFQFQEKRFKIKKNIFLEGPRLKIEKTVSQPSIRILNFTI